MHKYGAVAAGLAAVAARATLCGLVAWAAWAVHAACRHAACRHAACRCAATPSLYGSANGAGVAVRAGMRSMPWQPASSTALPVSYGGAWSSLRASPAACARRKPTPWAPRLGTQVRHSPTHPRLHAGLRRRTRRSTWRKSGSAGGRATTCQATFGSRLHGRPAPAAADSVRPTRWIHTAALVGRTAARPARRVVELRRRRPAAAGQPAGPRALTRTAALMLSAAGSARPVQEAAPRQRPRPAAAGSTRRRFLRRRCRSSSRVPGRRRSRGLQRRSGRCTVGATHSPTRLGWRLRQSCC
jgi:hypothetical protein